MSSHVFNNKTPWSKPTSDLFALKHRVFGYIWFVHRHGNNICEPDQRENQKHYVWNSITQKGYKHLNLAYENDMLPGMLTFWKHNGNLAFSKYTPQGENQSVELRVF